MAAWVADQAKSVSAVVIDPWTGEIYAEATYPSYDANEYQADRRRRPDRFVDPVVSSVYEPGSVFKMLTAIAGLETGTVTHEDEDQGRRDSQARRRPDPHRRRRPQGHGLDDVRGRHRLLAQRRRGEGRARAGRGRPERRRRSSTRTWTQLGLREPRPGSTSRARSAASSTTRRSRPGSQIDLANGSFGQGVAVTPIQLATAFAAMVNGGTLVQPHVVKSIGTGERAPAGRGQVMEPSLSITLTDLMQPRRDRGPDIPRPHHGPGLRRRRQDRHGPDLGSDRPRRPRRLEAQPLQLHVRRVHRPRGGHRRPRRRGQDQRGHAEHRPRSASSRCRSCRSSCSAGSRPMRSPGRASCRSVAPPITDVATVGR